MKCRKLHFSTIVLILLAASNAAAQDLAPVAAPSVHASEAEKAKENAPTQSAAATKPAESSSGEWTKKGDSETWMFFSRSSKTLEGIPLDMNVIEVTILGERISVPLSAIRGIRFGDGLFDVCTVKLMNGDTLNGSIERQIFRIGMEWGDVQVDRQKVGYFVRSAFARGPIPASSSVAQTFEKSTRDTRESQDSPDVRPASDVVPVSTTEPPTDGDYELAAPSEALDGDDSWLWGNPQ